MKKASYLLLSLLALAPGCATAPQAPQYLRAGWRLADRANVKDDPTKVLQPGYDDNGWHRAVVPGTVLTSLVADGTYAEPLYGENNRPNKIPEALARASYWYRTEFDPSALPAGQHVWLNLDGINYKAFVFVNGRAVGKIDGAFTRGRFDITDNLVPGKKAALAVLIIPPPHPGTPQEQTQALGTGPNGGVLAKDGPTFIASIGWDWIPAIRDRNIGIWRDVSISYTGPVEIGDAFVQTDLALPRTDSADVTITVPVHNASSTSQTCNVAGEIEGIRFGRDVALKPHEWREVTFSPKDTASLHMERPRLWWPNGYGAPNLYTLRLCASASGNLSDTRQVSFGIRKLTYHVPGTDNLTVCVNGVPIICKGGDWGMDEAMKRIPRARLDAQIRMHRDAHCTIIRNWVGQSTGDDFYDLCDRYGILIWDEFFQPNPSDGPDPDNVPVYLANVREKVVRFRNHPSIAVWCARNEGNPPANLDSGISALMTQLDPTRLYQKNSADGKGVRSGGPYSWRTPRQYYAFPESEAFKTEIGSVSIPTLEAVQAMMPEKDWWPPSNDDWAEHDLLRGAQNGDTYPGTLASRYGPSASLGDFVRKAQLANYEAFRAMFEGRFAKLFHPVTGVITWMSNPAQPSMVWQLYSHDLEPNAALFAVQKACEPVHVQLNQADDRVQVINTTGETIPRMRIRRRVFQLDGRTRDDQTAVVDARAFAATEVAMPAFPPELTATHFVKLELFKGDDERVSDNFYWRTARLVKPPATTSAPATTRPARRRNSAPLEDFTDMDAMPRAAVFVRMSRHDDAETCKLTVSLVNGSTRIALLTHLQLRQSNMGGRVLPVFYSDNYISLLAGEARTVEVQAPRAALCGDEPEMHIDGFNISQTTAHSENK